MSDMDGGYGILRKRKHLFVFLTPYLNVLFFSANRHQNHGPSSRTITLCVPSMSAWPARNCVPWSITFWTIHHVTWLSSVTPSTRPSRNEWMRCRTPFPKWKTTSERCGLEMIWTKNRITAIVWLRMESILQILIDDDMFENFSCFCVAHFRSDSGRRFLHST